MRRDAACLALRTGTLMALPALPAGCAGRQSALDPASPAAESIHRLGLWMYAGATLVVLLVVVLALVPVVRRRERTPDHRLFLWGGGVALPLATLAVLVPYVMLVGHEMREPTAPGRLSVEVTGHQFWWEMAYRRAPMPSEAVSANELRLPVGEPVELVLRADDVIHSFWVPNLAGKTDLTPGRLTRMVIQADRPGIFRGQCAEYCGLQHARMAFDVVVLPRAEFDAWLGRLAEPAREPASPQLLAGRALYDSLGCGGCHAVRGVSTGRSAPDLTQVGARHSIGAGALRGGVGNIAAWIASAPHLKPGITMPAYDALAGPQLRALAAYLESLK